MEPKFKNLIAFLFLMQNGRGVMDKSPDYIMEKFERYCGPGAIDDEFMWGLDGANTERFLNYLKVWKIL